ncbi:MAG: adenylate/guanylate cyclase domain-containing protein [Kiloniellales bacterium]
MARENTERRLAAILSADVVGYSRLMGADEAGTVASLKAHRTEFIDPKIAEHHGRIVKLMGDGALVEFASVVDAVECAVDIQRGMAERNAHAPDDRRMLFRIGVNLGDVIVEGDDIYGDGVNVAARLQGLAEPGGVCVSGDAYRYVKGKVDAAFADMGERRVKNIAETVRAYRVLLDPIETAALSAVPAEAAMNRPGIAVLPFNNISGDAEQEYFADGITEDIITLLAAWRSFPVIARNSTFAYKDQSPDVRQVASDLDARYVLEGSVRKAGNRVRITAQLIDGSTGKHLWAERFDRELEDVFAVQDEITAKIVAAIEPEMTKVEMLAVTQKRPENLNSWELYLRGMANMPSYGRQRAETKRLFEQSIEADPNFADAYAALALCYSADVYAQRADDVDAAVTAMVNLAKKAAAIDPRNFRIYHVLCMVHIWKGELKQAVEAGRKSVELNPSSPEAYQFLAVALSHIGEPEEAEECAHMCLKLSPIDPKLHNYYFQLMQATLAQRRFEEAYAHLEKCLDDRPHDVSYLGFKTILLGHLGRKKEASACLAEYLSKRGLKTADDYRRIFIPNSVQTELNLEGLRKAGWDV